MHELGVVFHIADLVSDVAKENKADKIKKVVMQIGEVSTVVNDQLIVGIGTPIAPTFLEVALLRSTPFPPSPIAKTAPKSTPPLNLAKYAPTAAVSIHI